MSTIQELMIELDGLDPETIKRVTRGKDLLNVRLAMLGLAALHKGESPLWWGYPPGVFISYKWEGEAMSDLVRDLADHVRRLGYRAFLDRENLDQDAHAYFQIPQYIASIQDCTFYLLLLTELAADMITARTGATTWIHDEYQHAVRLVNSGRLFIVPVLLEPKGLIAPYTPNMVLDLTGNRRAFGALDNVLTPGPIALDEDQLKELTTTVELFDKLFLGQQWQASDDLLQRTLHLGHTFDHQFRRMLLSIYTADRARLNAALDQLHSTYGRQLVSHIYSGYCARHDIPRRAV